MRIPNVLLETNRNFYLLEEEWEKEWHKGCWVSRYMGRHKDLEDDGHRWFSSYTRRMVGKEIEPDTKD